MNPNSAHQRWSFWRYRVYPNRRLMLPPFEAVKLNAGRFGRLMFGSASEMRVVIATDSDARLYYEVSIRTEGHPVHEAPYVAWIHDQWRHFLHNGFGPEVEIQTHAHLEAGDRQDGQPADQLIILPSIRLTD